MRMLLFLMLLCLNVQAELPSSLTTLDGRTYQGIISAKPDGNVLRIVHADGAAAIRFDSIPESSRSAFGYDAAKEASADARDSAAREQAAALAAKAREKQAAADAKTAKQDALIAKRKADALAQLRKIRFGGASYWSDDVNGRRMRQGIAHGSLMNAGYSSEEASSIVRQMISQGQGDPRPPKPPVDPEFTRPQGQLRGVPSGIQKKPGITRKG